MEEARVDLLQQAGMDMAAIEKRGVLIPVLGVSCEYKSMTRFGAVVTVAMQISKYNGIKLEIEYEIRNKQTQELRAVGSSSHCFLSKDGRLLSLKRQYPEIDAIFEGFLRSQETGQMY